jgi:hypothetical protein
MQWTMKAAIMMSCGLALATTGALARDWDFNPREPSLKQPGHYEWNWDGKDGLTLGAPATLRYTPEGTPRITVTGPQEVLDHIQVGQGYIRVDRDYHYMGRERAQITVTGITVHDITLAGSGHMMLEKLDLDRLHLEIAGSGTLSAEGRADRLSLIVAGSGNSDLSRLAVKRTNIDIAGSGNVKLTPSDEATLSVAGSGTVHMNTRPPRLTQSITGSGGARIDSK